MFKHEDHSVEFFELATVMVLRTLWTRRCKWPAGKKNLEPLEQRTTSLCAELEVGLLGIVALVLGARVERRAQVRVVGSVMGGVDVSTIP